MWKNGRKSQYLYELLRAVSKRKKSVFHKSRTNQNLRSVEEGAACEKRTGTMPLEPPPVYKAVKPYLSRADELDASPNPEMKIVAFYCRQYAMEKGLEIKQNDTTGQATKDFLIALMNKLEADKGTMPAPPTKATGQEAVLKTATGIFTKADEEDRAGFSDKNTARTFYMAACFFDVLLQFGELESEVESKRLYAKWKSTEILKAIKEGRPVTPGGPGEEGVPGGSLAPPPSSSSAAPAIPPSTTTSSTLPTVPGAAPTTYGGPSGGPASPPPPAVSPPPFAPGVGPVGGNGGGGIAGLPPAYAGASAPMPAPAGAGAGGGGAAATATAFNPGYQPGLPPEPPMAPGSGAAAAFVPAPFYEGGSLANDASSVIDALEWCKFGVRFLESDRDVAKAAQYLENAVRVLKGQAPTPANS